MSEANKSYRIRTDINSGNQYVNVDFTQNYEKLEILSLEINQSNSYQLMNSRTGIIVGRVLANEGFGIPNAKVSVFIEYENDKELSNKFRYHYNLPNDLNEEGIRYNLLPNTDYDSCKQAVGTMPTKRYLLDNNDVIEVFDKYYTYTTRTNNSGDYMIYGVPTGNQRVHCDIDLSDIGVLSQTPRDMIYKGYPANMFESPSKFKKSTNLNSLAQIVCQDTTVFVYPFWGDTTDNPIGAAISRCDVNIPYKFEPTCVFLGSIITDTGDNSISKKCVSSKASGKMSEMTSGSGMIEMIRKTVDGSVEQISVQGNEVINDNGVWCYQIPMNLDYIMTDEYGNTVLSDNPNKGIPTRTRVRFRISMHENPADGIARKRARYLVPNNPRLVSEDYPSFCETKTIDYEFGDKTKDEDFRDLMWNNVYTVKNYIPRIQKSRLPNNLKFSGIKMTNHSGKNSPMPYNKLSIKFNFMYTFMCVLIKTLIQLTRFANTIIYSFQWMLLSLAHSMIAISNRWFWPEKLTFLAGIGNKTPDNADSLLKNIQWTFPDFGVIYYGCNGQQLTITKSSLNDGGGHGFSFFDKTKYADANRAAWCGVAYFLWACCYKAGSGGKTKWSINNTVKNANLKGLAAICCAIVVAIGRGIVLENLCDDENGNPISVTPGPNPEYSDFLKFVMGNCDCFDANNNVSELYNCVENQLAQENEVTSFNFYNDWINGVLYMPLWFRKIKPKRKFLIVFNLKAKDQWCNGDNRALGAKRRKLKVYGNGLITRSVSGKETLKPLYDDYKTVDVKASKADDETGLEVLKFKEYSENNCYGYQCHKYGRSETPIYSGLIIEKETIRGEHVYYYKPTYLSSHENNELVTLFATDIVLLGSLNTCDLHGIPQFFKILEGTTYQMPPDLLFDNYEYKSNADNDNEYNTDERENYLINETTRTTEYTGADWGNLGVDQSNMPPNGIFKTFETNENIYDNGGLFYGISCFDSYTKPKSIINLERICEIGVSLDESQDILKTKATLTNASVNNDDSLYTTLTPDGYISYDEIYNSDYRSMFATMNGNFLKTKVNYETGLVEYDLTHQYLDNFDGSLESIMAGKTTHGTIVVNKIDTHEPASYINNHQLEKLDLNYVRFRFGDYTKVDGKKLYFYQYNKVMTKVYGKKVYSSRKFPRYENSFYFYFGLNDGKTAIDKFYSEYYSDCAENVNLGKGVTISHVGNEWCSHSGGYIKFETNFSLPLSITLTNGENTYSSDGIGYNKFFIGNDKITIPNYKYIEITENNTVPDPMKIDDGEYNITIIDGDGIEHNEKIAFYNEDTVEFSIEKYDFNLTNNDLIDRFSNGDDNRMYRVKDASDNIVDVIPFNSSMLGSSYVQSAQPLHYIQYGKIYEDETGTKVFSPTITGYSFDFATNTLTDNVGNKIDYFEYDRIEYKDGNDNILAVKDTVVEKNMLKMETSYAIGFSDLTASDKLSVNFYNKVADSGNTIQGRDIYGYIVISDINVDDFKIRIKPSNDGDLSNFKGVEVQVVNGNISYSGHGYLGKSAKGEYYFGMPYGNVNYVIDVIYLCETESEGSKEPVIVETSNFTRTYITVYEGVFKMFINGIDYDIIKRFKTGYNETTMNAISQTQFDSKNIYGWDDIDNIGLKDYPYPIQPNISITPTEYGYEYTVENINEIVLLGESLLNTVNTFNPYYKPSPYNWFDEYVISDENWRTYTKDDIILTDDINGKHPGESDYILTYSGELANVCNTINEIIERRIDLTREMQGNFRLNAYNSLEINISYRTKQTPVKYLIVNNLYTFNKFNNGTLIEGSDKLI